MPKLLIVIPAYNEEGSIERVVDDLIQNYPQYDYVVVNDGSRDRTAAICRSRGYRLIDLPVNLGLAGAFQTGLRYAAEHGYDCAMQLNMIRTGIQKAVEEGIKADRTKVELITNVSHDIKTPLTSIISYVELLKREPDLPPHVMDYIKTISQKADRLNHIVQDVFEVSKAATGNISLDLEDLDIGKLLQQTFGEMEEDLRQSTLAWRVEIPDTPMLVHADGQRLYRVFQNLIRNCDQYALEGSRVYVNLTAQPNPAGGGLATVMIRNISRNEITMDADHLTARFVRGDQNRTTEGSGLGLSIAKTIADAHRIKIQVESEYGSWICFVLTL